MKKTYKDKKEDQLIGKLFESLEKGKIPWKDPVIIKRGIPFNPFSKSHYRGLNYILLAFAEFECPCFGTFKQISGAGGTIKKGSKSFPVVFYKPINCVDENNTPVIDENTGEQKVIWLRRYYNVFNLEQTEGLKIEKYWIKDDIKISDKEKIIQAEKVIKNYKNSPEIEFKNGTPCYIPAQDKIRIPESKYFRSSESYYSTIFHEMTHSTGHKSRLNREGITGAINFGSKDYSFEELVAEIGASLLCAKVGIIEQTFDNSVAYCQGWLKALRKKDNKKWFFQAGSKSQSAIDHILGS